MSDRDLLLGDALRSLGVPDHAPSFRMPTHRALPLIPTVTGIAVVATACAALVVVLGLRPQPASAAEVLREIARAVAVPHSVSGVVVDSSSGIRYAVLVGRDGSYRVVGPNFATAYDAREGLAVSRERGLFVRWRSVDPGMFSFALNQSGYANALHALLGSHGARVSPTTYAGRPAWRVELHQTQSDPGFYVDGRKTVLVVDRETGFVLSAERYLTASDQPTTSISLENLRVDISTRRSEFTLVRPAGTAERRRSWGFRRVTPGQAGAVVGYRPLLPTDSRGLPLIALAAARRSGSGSLGVISAVYGNGFAASLAYSTRRYTPAEGMPPASDLNDVRSFQFATPRRIRLTGGVLAGTEAWISASPLQSTYLWAARDGVVVRIVSTLPADDVLAVADSVGR